MKSIRTTRRTYPTKPGTTPAHKEAQPESRLDRFLITFAGTDSIETSLWLVLALLITSGYCLALLAH